MLLYNIFQFGSVKVGFIKLLSQSKYDGKEDMDNETTYQDS
mgnify:CR=1 FL=1